MAFSKVNYRPWVLNLNSRITLITTFSLTLGALVIFYFTEYNNTLAEHNGFGKIVTALFGAATPRTAGFNSIDTAALGLPALMMVFLLMWIGASPSSTGGGIKTSTFAIATLNILSLAKGKTRIEIFRREIADISVRRAFAIISLSLIVIGMGIMLISFFDKDKNLMSIAFECFSAYSTVGLSLGITAELSEASKLVIMVVMFVGRVSMLSIIIAVFKKVRHKNYSYPTEEITSTALLSATASLKLPPASVVVPRFVPLIVTEAFAIGLPSLLSVTFPVTVLLCAKTCIAKTISRKPSAPALASIRLRVIINSGF